MNVLVLLILALACARITRLIVEDVITLPIRRAAVRRFGEDDWRTYLLHCRACVSVWVGLALAVIGWKLAMTGPWQTIVLVGLALSYVTILLGKAEDRL